MIGLKHFVYLEAIRSPMKTALLPFMLILNFLSFCYSQDKQIIETKDIENFWVAYDKLISAKSNSDSIKIFQNEYIDKATGYFKEFIKLRDFTAKEYVDKIGKFPKFWKTVRPLTESVKNRKTEIEKVLDASEKSIPHFKRPNVCFAIGCLRTGGTTSSDLILIGTEIASANLEIDRSELTPWLKSVIGSTGDVVEMIAHEVIHTQQSNLLKSDLLITGVINEGVADFLAMKLLGSNTNKRIHEYGKANECELKKEYLSDVEKNINDYSHWLYNGDKIKDKQADLGYYMGYKIAEDFYDNSKDKAQAIKDLLNRKNYTSIFKKSNYLKEKCN
jgi:hypothetical protein